MHALFVNKSITLSNTINDNESELITLWFTDKILGLLEYEKQLANKALDVFLKISKKKLKLRNDILV